MLLLVIRRGGGNENGLGHELFEFGKFQGPVIQGGRQAEAIFHQVFLTGPVPLVHAPHLGNGNVGFVNKHQGTRWQVVQQGGRRVPGFTAGKVAGVIFDPLAKSQFIEHFQVKTGALLNALGLHKLPVLLEIGEPHRQFIAYVAGSPLEVVLRGNKVAGRVQHGFAYLGQHLAREGINLTHEVDVVAKKFQPQRPLVMVGGNDFKGIAAHAEGAAVEVVIIALVVHFHQPGDELVHGEVLAHLNGNDHFGVIFRRTKAVNARNRSHNDHVAPGQQGVSGGMAQFVDVVVDGRIFFNIGI